MIIMLYLKLNFIEKNNLILILYIDSLMDLDLNWNFFIIGISCNKRILYYKYIHRKIRSYSRRTASFDNFNVKNLAYQDSDNPDNIPQTKYNDNNKPHRNMNGNSHNIDNDPKRVFSASPPISPQDHHEERTRFRQINRSKKSKYPQF